MSQETRNLQRAAGVVLIACSIASLVALTFDRGGSATDTRGVLQQVAALAPLREMVHVAQMTCLVGYAFSFSVLAMALGLRRGPVLAATAAFMLGVAMMLIATVNDGFLTSAVGMRFATAPDGDLEIARDLLRYASLSVSYFGDLAFVLMAAGVALWSTMLLRRGRLAAAAGLAEMGQDAGQARRIGVWPHAVRQDPERVGDALPQQVLLAGEVIVEGRAPHLGPIDHVIDGDRLVVGGQKQFDKRRQAGLPRAAPAAIGTQGLVG